MKREIPAKWSEPPYKKVQSGGGPTNAYGKINLEKFLKFRMVSLLVVRLPLPPEGEKVPLFMKERSHLRLDVRYGRKL